MKDPSVKNMIQVAHVSIWQEEKCEYVGMRLLVYSVLVLFYSVLFYYYSILSFSGWLSVNTNIHVIELANDISEALI